VAAVHLYPSPPLIIVGGKIPIIPTALAFPISDPFRDRKQRQATSANVTYLPNSGRAAFGSVGEASAPCAWKTVLAISNPIVVTSDTDASLKW
jgi:hypothetical protein